MNVKISPSKLTGKIIVPPSKSLSHRAIIASALAEGKSVIRNVKFSEDIKATLNAIKAIGANFEINEDTVTIYGSKVKRINNVIDANESGSTIRFMIPISLVNSEPVTFVGKNRLVKRPLDMFFNIFDLQGIKYEHGEDYLPLKTYGGLKPGIFDVRGDVSSQFITGLLFALPLLNGNSIINITTKLESKGYIDLTLDILEKYGIKIINNNYQSFEIIGNQKYIPFDYTVEGDYSQAAFFLVADMLGADIKLKGMNLNSYQGDKKILDDIKSFGGNIEIEEDYIKAYGTPISAIIDFSQSPDLGPALTVLASLSKGKSKFINAERLRIKECDRITCMKEELEKAGAHIEEFESGMDIDGVSNIHSATFDCHNDHRVAMALSLLALKLDEPFVLKGAECVKKSFPDYFKVFESLGGIISYED